MRNCHNRKKSILGSFRALAVSIALLSIPAFSSTGSAAAPYDGLAEVNRAPANYEPTGEDFKKGALSESEWSLSALTGLGIVNSTYGFATIGALAKKILHHGFAPEINNQVFVEIEAGPVFGIDGTPVFFSGHLRWDFQKDEQWRLFALGGLAGHVGSLGNDGLFPRFGLGAMMELDQGFSLRGEISHELLVAGLSFGI